MSISKKVSKSDECKRLVRGEEGVTLVEMLVAMSLLLMLAIGVIQLMQLASRTLQSDTNGATRDANFSILRRIFLQDLADFELVSVASVPNQEIAYPRMCTTWNSANDPGSNSIRSIVTFTNNSKNRFVGYEVRSFGNSSEIWRIECSNMVNNPNIKTSSIVFRGLPALSSTFLRSANIVSLATSKSNPQDSNYISDFPQDVFLTLNLKRQSKTILSQVRSSDTSVSLRDFEGIKPGSFMTSNSADGWSPGFPYPTKSTFALVETITVTSVTNGTTTKIIFLKGTQPGAIATTPDAKIEFISFDGIRLDLSTIPLKFNNNKALKDAVISGTRRAA